MLREHRERCRARAEELDVELGPDAFVFSGASDGSAVPTPDGMTQRYDRLVGRLGIETTFHKLRHYSATELIAAGVDVADGRGPARSRGGGTTTLRTYTAWVSEADQRAATGIGSGMPVRPAPVDRVERARTEPRHPYQLVARALAEKIRSGDLVPGEVAPTAHELADEHGVSIATARRAVALAKEWGLVVNESHARPRIGSLSVEPDEPPSSPAEPEPSPAQFCSITLRGPDGRRYPPRLVPGSLADPGAFRARLIGIARVEAPEHTDDGESWVGDFELEVVEAGATPDQPPITLRW